MPIIKGFVLPHPPIAVHEVGRGREKEMQNTIGSLMRVADDIAVIKPDTIIVTTPHGTTYSDYIHISPGANAEGSFYDFGAGNVRFNFDYDTELVEEISTASYSANIPAGTLGEMTKSLDHGTLVPLYFINKKYKDYKLIRISISGLSSIAHYKFGKLINNSINKLGRKCVIIASGDLSHKLTEDGPYGYDEQGPIFDKELTEALAQGDFLKLLLLDEEACQKAAQCGLQSFNILAGCFDNKSVSSNLLSYEGPFGVGYAVCEFKEEGSDNSRDFDKQAQRIIEDRIKIVRDNESDFVRLARDTVENYVKYKNRINRPEKINSDLLNKKAGVFVTLKINGRLRGCIGTISPVTSCVADEIIRNGIGSCSEDPRFDPVESEELPYITYSVDVLGEPEPINSIKELDPKKYGVIVKNGRRRGLLLPDLEGVDTVSEQISYALQKAGISQDEDYTVERFMVIRYK